MVSRKDKYNNEYLGYAILFACIVGFFFNSSGVGFGAFVAVAVGLIATGRIRI